ncbi:MAG: hypothetical protein ACYSWU_15440, partial [Planctomycetota bacterium]
VISAVRRRLMFWRASATDHHHVAFAAVAPLRRKPNGPTRHVLDPSIVSTQAEAGLKEAAPV